jgi:lysyl-tRNA synthetase class 2
MASLEEIKTERLKKLEILKNLSINPYPAKIELVGSRIHARQARARLKEVESGVDEEAVEAEIVEEQKFHNQETHHETVVLAGRVMSSRGSGKIIFIDLADETGKFQIVLKADVLSDESLKTFINTHDIGDFYAFSGKLFITQRGEPSLECANYQLLTKSVLPTPTSYFGFENEEEAMRKRYLDFAVNPEKRELFYKKSKFWDVTRRFLLDRGFLEVETPTIEVTTGGAEARPFKTYHNDFDMDVYMRISIGELWQKRLMAAGFEKTFEIGRAYRNEGSSPFHLQEFTNCEFYWAYADYRDGMEMIKDLYRLLAREVFGTTKFDVFGYKFDLADEWEEIEYVAEIEKRTGININTATDKEIESKLQELGVKYEGENRERMTDSLWKFCRKQIHGPAFLIGHPTLVSPLSKRRADGKTVERFQPIFAGAEMGNGFSEQNNPEEQMESFMVQQKLIESGDEEAMMPDFEFVEMLEYGMPPTFGWGFGERMFSTLAGIPIREAQLFPLVKPKIEKIEKKQKVAHVILNKSSNLENWQNLNTVGHLCAEFAGKTNISLFLVDKIKTRDNKEINLNMQYPVIIKQAENNSQINNLITDSKDSNIEVYSFTREMLMYTNDKKVTQDTLQKNFEEIEFLGILVFGDKEIIENITRDIKYID